MPGPYETKMYPTMRGAGFDDDYQSYCRVPHDGWYQVYLSLQRQQMIEVVGKNGMTMSFPVPFPHVEVALSAGPDGWDLGEGVPVVFHDESAGLKRAWCNKDASSASYTHPIAGEHQDCNVCIMLDIKLHAGDRIGARLLSRANRATNGFTNGIMRIYYMGEERFHWRAVLIDPRDALFAENDS